MLSVATFHGNENGALESDYSLADVSRVVRFSTGRRLLDRLLCRGWPGAGSDHAATIGDYRDQCRGSRRTAAIAHFDHQIVRRPIGSREHLFDYRPGASGPELFAKPCGAALLRGYLFGARAWEHGISKRPRHGAVCGRRAFR